MKIRVIGIFYFLFPALLFGAVIIVPVDHETIQGAIDAAEDNDTLFVMPGEYTENISFDGKAIKLLAGGSIAPTIIDGGGEGPCVVFTNREDIRSILAGFILTNGVATGDRYGGGILVEGASPIILMNSIVDNSAAEGGGGISASAGGVPIITRNLITDNTSEAIGGGISLYQCSGIIFNNTITGNVSGGDGSAVNMPFTAGVQLFNNIVVANDAGNGAAISGWQAQALNNRYNDVWNNEGGNYANNIQAGEGSISENPQFVDAGEGDYHLTEDSPCIDAGDPDMQDVDGSRVDMGAFPFMQEIEFEPITVDPDTVIFEAIPANESAEFPITISNPNESEINLIFTLPEESKFSLSDSILVLEPEGESELMITFIPDGEVGEWSDSLRFISLSLIEVEIIEDTLVIPRPVGYMALKISGASVEVNYIDQQNGLPSEFGVITTYPNPFNSTVEILIRNTITERADVSIWNASGRLVETIYSGLLENGESRWNWSAESYTAGMYFVRYVSKSQSLERKIQFIK